MSNVLAERLSEKAVIGTDGTEIGSLYNITMDIDTGRLEDLLVTPEENADDLGFEFDDSGRYRVPVHHVQSVRDHIVVQR